MSLAPTFRKYLLPGFVFQSVVIAGGYGTGRELVEFFLRFGPAAGLTAMILISTVVWSAVAALTFELARRFRAYDYRRFFRRLLGRGWVAFEAAFLVALPIILAVVAAAAGTILHELFGLPYAAGVAGIMVAVALVVLGGSERVERFLAAWSFVLYVCYLALVTWSFLRFGDAIRTALGAGDALPGWAVGGLQYGAYNVSTLPPLLFVARHFEARREAVAAGLLAGPIAMVPALFFYLAMVAHYPEIVARPVPANHVLEALGSRPFQLVFQLVLFGTLIETGAGFLHGVNERIAGAFADRSRDMPALLRPAVALAMLGVAAALSGFGLIDLIAKGYGALAWVFLAVYVVPLFTLGAWLAFRRGGESASSPADAAAEGR